MFTSFSLLSAIMLAPEVQHKTLNATFRGCESNEEGAIVHKFLGIKYASVPARFERAVPVDTFAGAIVDATKYGYVYICGFSKILIPDIMI
jgi:carboxylesterase type B